MANKIIRCYEGEAKPGEAFWKIRNATETGTGEAEIDLYGTISEISWFGDEVTPQKFKDDLYQNGAGGPITIRMNSGGGDVIAASVIRSILRDYPGKKTVKIDGLAASAAVIVALACDRILIQDTAYMMIHDPGYAVFLAYLDIETMEGLINTLKPIKAGIADTYASKTGISVDRINKMMSEETWMNANKAVDLGFADEVMTAGRDPFIEEDGGKNTNQANLSALKNYRNVPAALLNQLPPCGGSGSEPVQSSVSNTGEPGLSEPDEVRRLRDELKLIL